MKATITLLVSLGVLLIGAAWFNTPKTRLVSESEVVLGEIAQSNWQLACFAPSYHILRPADSTSDNSQCRYGKEVPAGQTYLTFYLSDGSCEQYRFDADFLVYGGADYRCFPRDENEDVQIEISNGILSLQ